MTHTPLAFRLLTVAALSLAATHAGAACYTVYDASGQVVHRTDAPPTNSAEAGTVPEGGRVLLSGAHCAAGVPVAEQLTPARATGRAPLLTDVQTAARAQTPYAVMGRNIAVAAPANAEQVWQRAAVVASTAEAPPRRASTETVITEWADGRVEVERRPAPSRH